MVLATAPAAVADGPPAMPATNALPAVPVQPGDVTAAKAGLSPAAVTTPSSALQKNSPAQLHFSPYTSELLRLAQAGLEQGVMMAYVDSAGTFNLTTDQIIHLRDVGISPDVIAAILQHDAEIISGLRTVPASGVPGATSPTTVLSFRPGVTAAPNTAAQPEEQAVDAEPEPDFWWLPPPMPPIVASPPELYPVRKPYPVPLTDPILIWPIEPRPANLVTLRMFP